MKKRVQRRIRPAQPVLDTDSAIWRLGMPLMLRSSYEDVDEKLIQGCTCEVYLADSETPKASVR